MQLGKKNKIKMNVGVFFTAGVLCLISQLSVKALLYFFFSRETSESLFLAACGGLSPGRPLGGTSHRAGSPALPLTGPNAASRSAGSAQTLQPPWRVLSLCFTGAIGRGDCKETLPPNLQID